MDLADAVHEVGYSPLHERKIRMNQSVDDGFFERGLEYLRSIDDIRAGLTNIVRSAAAAVGSDCASLYLVNESTQTLEPYILVNIPATYLKGCASVPLGRQCCGRAALYKMPWAVADMWTDPLFSDCAEAARHSGIRSGFSVPVLLTSEECVGALGVQFQHVYQPGPSDIARLTMFARLISMAIQTDMENRNAVAADWVSTQLATGPLAA